MVSIAVEDGVLTGLFLAMGSALILTAMMLGESMAPGYSMNENAISDLGTIDETRLLFNTSVFALGLLNILAGFFLLRVVGDLKLMIVFATGGLAAMGVGLVPLDSPLGEGTHGLFAFLTFLFLNLEAILCARLVKNPLRFISIVAGVLGLIFIVVMVLVDSETIDLSGSIGHGGVERMIAFPALIWMMIFGGHLLASPQLLHGK